MTTPKALVLSGYGLNCEDETKTAFELAGGEADIVHINDLIDAPNKLRRYQILAVPGGFSFGDDTGSGKAYANKLKNHLSAQLNKFVESDKLVIGICNGFQILANLGFLPGALTFNDSVRYTDRWVDVRAQGRGPWLRDIKTLSVPIAHGEGKYAASKKTLAALKNNKAIAIRYVRGEICRFQDLPPNPNGSAQDIAGVTSSEGRVLGLMPHPERAVFFTQLPHWTYLKEKLERQGKKIPVEGPGLQIYRNGVKYFN